MDAYFHLLEHEELREARKSSRTATRFATAALCVSIVTGGLSISSSFNPTKLASDQLDALTRSRPGETSIESKLDELIRVHDDLLLAFVDNPDEEVR